MYLSVLEESLESLEGLSQRFITHKSMFMFAWYSIVDYYAPNVPFYTFSLRGRLSAVCRYFMVLVACHGSHICVMVLLVLA